VGTREWDRTVGHSWQPGSYGATPFSASSYFDWWAHFTAQARLIDVSHRGGDEYADVADLAEMPDFGPVWFRYHIDLTTEHVETVRMITLAHFMTLSWTNFNDAPPITPPAKLDKPRQVERSSSAQRRSRCTDAVGTCRL
jgi:hypothetical protein